MVEEIEAEVKDGDGAMAYCFQNSHLVKMTVEELPKKLVTMKQKSMQAWPCLGANLRVKMDKYQYTMSSSRHRWKYPSRSCLGTNIRVPLKGKETLHFEQSSQPTAVLDLSHHIEANGTNSTLNAAIFVGLDYSPCVLWNKTRNRTTAPIMGIMEQGQ